jgi:hypothetical protein
MRYYFAGRYSRHAELAGYRDQLQLIPDAVVTSRWIDQHGGELEVSYTPEVLAADPAACWKLGLHDLEDLKSSRAVVSFTGNGGGGKGGRHVEHGVGLILNELRPITGFRLIVIGPRENIFHCHPATEVYPDFTAFLAHEVIALGANLALLYHPSLATDLT